ARTGRPRGSRTSSSSRPTTGSRWSPSTSSSSTAWPTTTPPPTVSSLRSCCNRVSRLVTIGGFVLPPTPSRILVRPRAPVFAPGYGATPASYASMLTRIAAAGYVVAAPTYPLLSGQPAGPTDTVGWEDLYGDTWFVTSQVLADATVGGLIDPNRIAVAGHSDGAAIA